MKVLFMANHQQNNGVEHVIAKSLWYAPDKSRQFLLPDTKQIPLGDFVLYTRSGGEIRVNEEAVLPSEVSDDEATAWLKAQLKNVIGQFGTGLRSSLFGSSQQHKKKNERDDNVTLQEEKQSSTTPGLDLLADITGTPRKSMNGSYGAIGHALRDYLSDIASTVGDSVSGESQREASARQRMDGWKQTLRKHGIKVADKGDQGKADSNSSGESSKTSGKGQKTDAAKHEDGTSKSGIGESQEPRASEDKGDHADDTSSHDSSVMAFREAEERLRMQLHRVGEAFQRLAKAGKARADKDDENHQKKSDE